MEEPSVLDYVKSKLTFWKPSSIEIPASPEMALEAELLESEGEGRLVDESLSLSPTAAKVEYPAVRFSAQGILLTAGALGLALIAQALIEPPNRIALGAAVLYAISAALIGLAYFRDLVLPAPIPADEEQAGRLGFRLEGLAVGLVLMVIAFFSFSQRFSKGEGDAVPYFNFLNTALWLLSLGYLIWALYLPRLGARLLSWQARTSSFLRGSSWKVSFTRWGLLLLVAAAVVLFFRFYRLEGVPGNMVSDHAEKLWDVQDVLNGKLRVFFPRNTGREAFQFYWTALMAIVFDTGISFMSLKLGTVLGGLLALVYTYRMGYLIGNRWVALFALLFCGFSYWANIQARFGLRFTLYPMFLAPMLFYLLRGLKEARRNDFIWAGLWLGAGLHGYTSFRIVPFVAVAAVAIYWLHHRSAELRKFAVLGLTLVALFSFVVFLPLARFTLEDPMMVASRSLTRLAEEERPLPGSPVEIFFGNTFNAMTMFFWDNGDVWVHSIPHRPALDVISAALFFLGVVLVILRYLRKRTWVDLFLLLSIPLLLLPSILSLAFPNENPNLNRTAGAYIPVFLILAIGLDALLNAIKRSLPDRMGTTIAWGLGLGLVIFSASSNYDLLFNQYDRGFRQSSWNTAEMGVLVRDFIDLTGGRAEDAWVVAYPYWVDTRLVGINAGFPDRDTAISPDQLGETLNNPRSKLFFVNPQDIDGLRQLQNLYPQGRYWLHESETEGKEFIVFLVPPQDNFVQN